MGTDSENKNPYYTAGLILTVLTIVVFLVILLLSFAGSSIEDRFTELLVIVEPFLPFAALAFSIAGFVKAKKQGERVKRSAACLIVSSLEALLFILFLLSLPAYLSRAKTTPPDYTIASHSPSEIESVREEIDRAMKEKQAKETSK